MHRILTSALVVVSIGLAGSAAGDEPEQRQHPNIRPLHPYGARLLQEALERSATVRALVAEIDRHDLVVYIQLSAFLNVPTGRSAFLTSTPLHRYLVVTLNSRNTFPDLIVNLGHELRHAVEVADTPEVRDNDSFRSFYERIGSEHREHMFETDAAAAINAKVRSDLNHYHPG
jgi:hypothetical protein